jgi:hypothetical protein
VAAAMAMEVLVVEGARALWSRPSIEG